MILVAYVTHVHGPAQAGREAALFFVLLPAASSVVSSWPTLRTTFALPGRERPLSWLLSAGSDALVAGTVLAEGLEWQYLAYPVVTMLTQLAIAVSTTRGREAGTTLTPTLRRIGLRLARAGGSAEELTRRIGGLAWRA